MADFDLYYWPVPFRGQFIRAILAYAEKSWREHDPEKITDLMASSPFDQPVPFMGPPVLIDNMNGFCIAEMPAIAFYLGEKFDLLPLSPEDRALSLKVINDANDVLDELTLDGGREMWTAGKWEEFTPRLERWMTIWEATASARALDPETGTLLGTDNPGVADIVTATLWSTMGDRFTAIAQLLEKTSPRVTMLTHQIQAIPQLAKLSKDSHRKYGNAYCGGEIEKSLRKVALGCA